MLDTIVAGIAGLGVIVFATVSEEDLEEKDLSRGGGLAFYGAIFSVTGFSALRGYSDVSGCKEAKQFLNYRLPDTGAIETGLDLFSSCPLHSTSLGPSNALAVSDPVSLTTTVENSLNSVYLRFPCLCAKKRTMSAESMTVEPREFSEPSIAMRVLVDAP